MLQVDSIIAVTGDRIRAWQDLFNWPLLVSTGLRVLGALVVALLALWAMNALLRRVERSVGDAEPGGVLSAHEQRARTLVGLLRGVGRVVIFTITVFMVLDAVGVKLGPLLAGAGVVGLAISFGAQSLVKDVISGLFILIEDQFGVGDVIRIEGVSGAVERMSLRMVVLRDDEGVVHIVPNGQITKVSNLTRAWSRVVMDVSVAYREDPDRVMRVMREVGEELWEDPEWRPLLVGPVEVLGIERFGESSVQIRLWVKVLPLKKSEVARELRRRLKLRFDREGIEIPLPQQTVFWHASGESRALEPAGGPGAADDDNPSPSHAAGGGGDDGQQAM